MERRDFLKLAFATGVLSCIDVMGKAYGIELKTNEFSSGEYQAMIDAFKANPARAT